MARDTPHNVDGLALVVLLQDKHTRPLVIGRVLFDHGALPGPCKDIRDKNTICRKLIIPVIRDEYLLTCYQVENALKDLTYQEILAPDVMEFSCRTSQLCAVLVAVLPEHLTLV